MAGTHESQAQSWRRYTQYVTSICLENDPFLNELDRQQCNKILCCFALAMHHGRYSGQSHDRLAAGTVSNSISNVCLTFRENSRPNPTKDDDLQSSFLLSRLYRAFKNKDPREKQQKATPPCVIVKIIKIQVSDLHIAISQLAVIAFFFAMRSCEYLKVPQSKKRRNDGLRLKSLRFIKDGKLLQYNNPQLHLADCVAITFKMEKKDEKSDTVHHKATNDKSMCPV